ncbi:YKU80 [Candida metapsilosis]|uniref:DNA helicase n=1 Tax=Candida metapsilosis TaxID=273372 RepID=A0A8H8DCN9_9ASCO|nr:YKU80 [Candida metapsilosis]
MSNKEYITIVIDASRSMDTKSVSGSDETDFQLALKFAMNLLNKQLLKNRKSDRYALIVYTPADVQFYYQNTPVTFSRVKEFYELLVRAHSESMDTKGDFNILHALADSLENQIANKFIRSVFIVTNGVGSVNDDNIDLDKLRNISENYSVTTNLLLLENEDNKETKQYFEELAETFDGRFNVFPFEEFANNGPPLKLIGPRCMTDCTLSFVQGDSNDIHLAVQVYPAIKSQSQVHGHEYLQDPQSKEISRVKRQTKYYIKGNTDIANEFFESGKNNEENSEDDKEYVKDSEYSYGFKYSQRNVVALLPELEEAATLETTPGINIMGFIDMKKLPVAYLTDEPAFVIPGAKSDSENKVAFNSFVQSLIDLKRAAIVRYVQKETYEVQVCCALAQRFQIGDNWGHGLILHRLAMKEDEKIGKFPEFKSGEDELDSVMEKFVASKKLTNDITEPDSLSNLKLGLLESKPFTEKGSSKTSLENMLLSSCPSTKRFNYYVEKILYKSLNEESLTDFVSQDQFIEKYLTSDEKHTLLNIDNIFDVKGESLFENRDSAAEAALRSAFEIKFTMQAKPSRKKRKTDSVFGAEHDEQFDEYFDIDEILAG